MTITLCASLDFLDATRLIKEQLEPRGVRVEWPNTMQLIADGTCTPADIAERRRPPIASEAIRIHYEKIRRSDAVLIVNIEKRGISNYIGGNTFLEIGFAYILGKPIYLLHPIPDVPYRSEIEAMHPIVLHGDLDRLPLPATV